MISDGVLPARRCSAGWLVPDHAVTERSRHRQRGRPLTARTTWAVIAALDTADDDHLPLSRAVSDRRLRHQVITLVSALMEPMSEDAWRQLLARRGHFRRAAAHPDAVAGLLVDARVSGPSPRRIASDHLYVRECHVDRLVADYRLRDDPAGGVTLVVVPQSVPSDLAPRGGRPAPLSAVAAGRLDNGGPTERRMALGQLQAMRDLLLRNGNRRSSYSTTNGVEPVPLLRHAVT
jgi:hypothetical protein